MNALNFDFVRCLILCSKFVKNRLLAGLCPDPLGELTALPQAPTWITGEGGEMGDGRAEGEGRERVGKGRWGGEGRGEGREEALPQTHTWITGEGVERGDRRAGGEGRERVGKGRRGGDGKGGKGREEGMKILATALGLQRLRIPRLSYYASDLSWHCPLLACSRTLWH